MSDELKILIVENNGSDVQDFNKRLNSIGIFNKIDWVTSVSDAIMTCENYDLIILDVFLGSENSLDFINKIKERSRATIFVYSGIAKAMRKEAFEKGAEWVLGKPIDPLDFIAATLSLKVGSIKFIKKRES